MNEILSLDETDKIKGEIYRIINTTNHMCYVGQTRSHRKNKNKYRRFGSIGRFKDHISEAINNTKKNQCRYLNNAIRINKDDFIVELIEYCEVKELDEKEQYYISFYNSLYPTGYNLTKGGRTTESVNISLNAPLESFKKRGRPSGFIHTEETKQKMKESLLSMSEYRKSIASTNERKELVSSNTRDYYDDFKIQKLSEYSLSESPENYIKEMKDKNGVVCDYKIYINREVRFRVKSKKDTLEEKYIRLKNILTQAIELKKSNIR